jgi:hypothetical protein
MKVSREEYMKMKELMSREEEPSPEEIEEILGKKRAMEILHNSHLGKRTKIILDIDEE